MFAFEKEANSIEHAAALSTTKFYWFIYGGNDYSNFDFDYRPPPWEAHHIHVFASQWQACGDVFFCNTETSKNKIYNFNGYQKVVRLQNQENWYIPDYVDKSSVDLSWHSNSLEPKFIHHFPSQWQSASGVIYKTPGAKDIKLTDDFVVRANPTKNWYIPQNIDHTKFDFSWHPNALDPPYNYEFATKFYPEGGPIFQSDNTLKKYISDLIADYNERREHFIMLKDIDNFDFTWNPHPKDPPYIYIFGNQHWPAEIMPTIKYHVPGATEVKYMDEPRAQLQPTKNNWRSLTDLPFDFDRSWCPDPGDPPFIYQFGNQWYPAEIMPTVEYCVAGATEIKYVDSIQARLLPAMDRWSIPEEVDSANIDFSWAPHPKDDPYIHHFGSDYQISTGLIYTVPGAVEPKFEGEAPRLVKEKSTVAVVDIFYIDRGNGLAQSRYERLREQYPNIQKVRYANSMLETVRRCVTRARTRKFWIISSMNVYDDFDFAWHAEPWQSYMTHIFPSQWNKWSDTYLINRYEFERHSKWAKGIEEFPNLHFVNNQTVKSSSDGSNIYYVDHGNDTEQLSLLQTKYSKIQVTRFVDNYLDTFKRIMSTADTEYVWIINSICDYRQFDFTWHPEAWQSEMIHVFPSGTQKRGDTFYIHVESFKKQMYELEILDWFNVINYCEDQYVLRYETPKILYEEDSIVDIIKSTAFNFPYAIFANKQDNKVTYPPSPCLWSVKDRIATPLSSNYSTSLIPRDIKNYINTQVYDYPYVSKDNLVLHRSKELDIVFISNGEPDEELMYHHTEYMVNRPVKWIRGVDGRVAAYQAAARASDTPWFFAVFAKLQVTGSSFPWNDWQPDYWQEPKHYIFNARNPVNGLEYGHQGMIAYNKKLVLENFNPGIDFTLSQPHESVPLLSGTAQFNQDPWTTWRTAFREVVKLKHFMATQPTLETEHRLETWLTVASGDYAEWCLLGARNAVDYYTEVNGLYEKLMFSFEWAWLKKRFNTLYTV